MPEKSSTREFLELSTRLAEAMTMWIAEAREHRGLSEDQLLTMQSAAEVIDQAAVRAAELETEE